MIYLDTSAVLTLAVRGGRSRDLRRWLAAHAPDGPVVGELTLVEAMRAARVMGPRVAAVVRELLDQCDVVPLAAVLERAGELTAPVVRTVDAVHLAGAELLGAELTAMVAYDEELVRAATAHGLAVVSP